MDVTCKGSYDSCAYLSMETGASKYGCPIWLPKDLNPTEKEQVPKGIAELFVLQNRLLIYASVGELFNKGRIVIVPAIEEPLTKGKECGTN